MSDDIIDRLGALIHESYHGDSMETMRDPIATLLKAQDEIKELQSRLHTLEEVHAALQVRCFDYGNPTHSSIFDERDYWEMIAEQRGEALDTACVKDQEQKSRLDAFRLALETIATENEPQFKQPTEAARLARQVLSESVVESPPDFGELIVRAYERNQEAAKKATEDLLRSNTAEKIVIEDLKRAVEKQEYAPFTAQELLDEPVLEAIKQMTDKAVETSDYKWAEGLDARVRSAVERQETK